MPLVDGEGVNQATKAQRHEAMRCSGFVPLWLGKKGKKEKTEVGRFGPRQVHVNALNALPNLPSMQQAPPNERKFSDAQACALLPQARIFLRILAF